MYRLDKDRETWSKMKPVLKRFLLNILKPFEVNPLSHDGKRKGYQDFFHSFTNIFVEFCRISPYHAGHWFQFLFILFIISLIF